MEILHQNIITILTILLALLCYFLISYVKERGKLKALRKENKHLVEETERIKSTYELDIAKRKYQYESKKEQYLNFFQMLNNFSNRQNVSTQEKLLPILEEFNRNFLNASFSNNKRGESNATTVMSKKIQALVFEANQDLIKIKQETNTIKLIASDAILSKLNLLELAYDQSMGKSHSMMNALSQQVRLGDQQGIQQNQDKIEISAMVINTIKKDIIELMRQELNEI